MSLRDKIGTAANIAAVVLAVLLGTLLVKGNSISRRGAISGRPSMQDQSPDSPGIKTVKLERQLREDPVGIVQILEGDADVTPGRRDPVTGVAYRRSDGKLFEAGADWLKNLTVVIKNFSNKEIVAGSFRVDFPETGSGTPEDPTETQPIMLGRRPEHALYSRDREKLSPETSEPLHLKPGEELRVPRARYYDALKNTVEMKRPIASITTCRIRMQFFYFTDGTRWAPYNFQKPETSTPGKYLLITADEFRGISSSY